MIFYEIAESPIPSELSNLPILLLKKVIRVLPKTARAHAIAVAGGGRGGQVLTRYLREVISTFYVRTPGFEYLRTNEKYIVLPGLDNSEIPSIPSTTRPAPNC